MKISKILVKNKSINYPILIGSNIIGQLKKNVIQVCPKLKKVALIIDKNIPFHLKKRIKNQFKNYDLFSYEFFVTENLKSFNKVNLLAESLLKNNFNRNDIIIAVGGGVIGDFAGFAASIIKRGINFINVPTTLLAQADASIGGKTGVNSKIGKNLLGTFYQPKLVLTELLFLKSLPKREIVCGYAEILKHSIIHDPIFFKWIKKNTENIIKKKNIPVLNYAVIKSCKIKNFYVTKDEHEKGDRAKLNFGHTFAHAIESVNNYSKNINHGEAVLIGMLLASKLSLKKMVCSKLTYEKIKDVYDSEKLNYVVKKNFLKKNLNNIAKYMISDKKNIDKRINLILLIRIGKTTEPGKIKISLKNMKKILKKII